MEIIEGRDVKLMCIVLLGNPTPKITWYRMGEPIHLQMSDEGQISDDGNGNLILRRVRVDDEGEYTCVASNAGGNATHITRLDVQGLFSQHTNSLSCWNFCCHFANVINFSLIFFTFLFFLTYK